MSAAHADRSVQGTVGRRFSAGVWRERPRGVQHAKPSGSVQSHRMNGLRRERLASAWAYLPRMYGGVTAERVVTVIVGLWYGTPAQVLQAATGAATAAGLACM